MRALFWISHFSLCRHKAEGRGSSAVSLLRALISFMRSLPSWPNQLPKAPRPKTTASGIRISTMNSGGNTNTQTTPSHSESPRLPLCVSVEADMEGTRTSSSTSLITRWRPLPLSRQCQKGQLAYLNEIQSLIILKISWFQFFKKKSLVILRSRKRKFPGGPVVRNWHSHCQGARFDPWIGN